MHRHTDGQSSHTHTEIITKQQEVTRETITACSSSSGILGTCVLQCELQSAWAALPAWDFPCLVSAFLWGQLCTQRFTSDTSHSRPASPPWGPHGIFRHSLTLCSLGGCWQLVRPSVLDHSLISLWVPRWLSMERQNLGRT